jgi:hypothetical protein
MKPKLKPPGTKHLKLKCDKPPLTFAFKFNLRCYILGATGPELAYTVVARCRFTLSKPVLKAHVVSVLEATI